MNLKHKATYQAEGSQIVPTMIWPGFESWCYKPSAKPGTFSHTTSDWTIKT